MRSILAGCLAVGTALASLQQPLHSTFRTKGPEAGFTTFRSDYSPHHSLRIKQQNDTICRAGSKQYTGWLDVGQKHLFFWYFESRRDPKNDPLSLWLTGGPGGSSMIGMLQELGPCLINEFGNATVYNPYGWSEHSNILFLDQPAGVGFSYMEEGEPYVDNSFTGAEDMHKFLQLFVTKAFPEHADTPFTITGESYGGRYIPALGAELIRQNHLHPKQPQINLKSVAIGNGFISPRDTAYGYWETLCTTKPGVDKPVFNSTICDRIAAGMPRVMSVTETCYARPDPAICAAAWAVTWDLVVSFYDGDSYVGGRNRFDITKPCLGADDMCYEASVRLEEYLNTPAVFAALEVPDAIKEYKAGSEAISDAFESSYDIFISTEPQVQYMLAAEVDVLFYQGNLDLACNTAGNLRWANAMPWTGQTEFASKPMLPWTSRALDGRDRKVGEWKQVDIEMVPGSGRKTRFAFVTIDGSGHLVPQDQPEVSLDMINRWLSGASFESEASSEYKEDL